MATKTGYCVGKDEDMRRISSMEDYEEWLEELFEQEKILLRKEYDTLRRWENGIPHVRKMTTKKQIEKNVADHRARMQMLNHAIAGLKQAQEG